MLIDFSWPQEIHNRKKRRGRGGGGGEKKKRGVGEEEVPVTVALISAIGVNQPYQKENLQKHTHKEKKDKIDRKEIVKHQQQKKNDEKAYLDTIPRKCGSIGPKLLPTWCCQV